MTMQHSRGRVFSLALEIIRIKGNDALMSVAIFFFTFFLLFLLFYWFRVFHCWTYLVFWTNVNIIIIKSACFFAVATFACVRACVCFNRAGSISVLSRGECWRGAAVPSAHGPLPL